MKTDDKRPRGRRRLLRGLGLALLALVAPGVASDAAQGDGLPQGDGDRTTVTDPGQSFDQLVAAADGSTWAWGVTWRGGAFRADPGGSAFSAVPGSDEHGQPLSRLTPLADGTVALVVAGTWTRDGRREAPRLLRLAPSAVRAERALPRVVADSQPALVLPDGVVWSARSCGDEVTRVSASGVVRRFQLSRLACHHVDDVVEPERSQTLVAGSDGAVWMANVCQGRVVRIDRRERVREWRVPSSCAAGADGAMLRTPVRADADGSLRLPGLRLSPRGSVTRSASISVPDVVTPDGSEWTLGDDGAAIGLKTAAGEHRTIDLHGVTGRFAWEAVAGADGRLWAAAADSERRRGDDVYGQALGSTAFAAIAADGTVSARTTPPLGPVRWRSAPLLLTTGADGFAWITEAGGLGEPSYGAFRRLVRIDVGAATAPAPRARLTASLGREGRRLWLQLSCTAAPGRWCGGTVRVADRRGRTLLTRPARYLLAGTSRAVVTATLAPRALRASRNAPLRARATVRGVDGRVATTAVTVPRGARR